MSSPRQQATIRRKGHYSTGEIAALFGCATRTAAKLIDDGAILGYTLPGSKVRRVLHATLAKFCREHPAYAFVIERLDQETTTTP